MKMTGTKIAIFLCGEQAHYDAHIILLQLSCQIYNMTKMDIPNSKVQTPGQNAATEIFSDIGPVVEGILFAAQGLRRVECTHIRRLGNKAAHALTRFIGF